MIETKVFYLALGMTKNKSISQSFICTLGAVNLSNYDGFFSLLNRKRVRSVLCSFASSRIYSFAFRGFPNTKARVPSVITMITARVENSRIELFSHLARTIPPTMVRMPATSERILHTLFSPSCIALRKQINPRNRINAIFKRDW